MTEWFCVICLAVEDVRQELLPQILIRLCGALYTVSM